MIGDFLYVACCSWMPSDYVDPCTPPSPSISLVHAYRDEELVSVPCNLLVQGDVVVLGPGHLAPAQVQQVNTELSGFVNNMTKMTVQDVHTVVHNNSPVQLVLQVDYTLKGV